jgi:hypothetical protein
MIIAFITFYILFSIAIGLGILRYEQELNNSGLDMFGVIIYPIGWPYFLGVMISKVLNNDYVLTFSHPKEQEEEDEQEESEEQ